MGGNNSRIRRRSQSLSELRSDSSRSTPSSIRACLSNLAQYSSKRLSKINFKRKDSWKSQTKAFTDIISHWKIGHVKALLREFEASKILLELSDQADIARPKLLSVGQELLASTNKDLTIKFKDHSYLVHSFLVRVRFGLLPPCINGVVSIDSLLPPLVNSNHIDNLIHWLYTDEWKLEEATLVELRSCLGSVHNLEDDLLRAEHLAVDYGDLEIIVTRDAGDAVEEGSMYNVSEARIRIDSSLIASRSTVLSRLINRDNNDENERSPLVLDECLLPRAFLPVIVHFLYTDQLDLNLISSSRAVCTSSLSEARAIISGHSPNGHLHRAAHLVHISRFLGLYKLTQLCEDVLLRELSLSTSVPLLIWSIDGGSQWLARMAKATILREFSRFVHTTHLYSLSTSIMEELLNSQFVQATEVDILEGIVRWGEHELLRRLELAEPNVVADTVHSVSRRGIKKSDMDSRQLRHIVSPLSSLIRVDYVLPPFHQSVTSAYQRGILERGSLRDLIICSSTSEIDPDLHWHSIPLDSPGPRLFLPYYHVVREVIGSSKEEDIQQIGTSKDNNDINNIIDYVVITNELPQLITQDEFDTISYRIRSEIDKDTIKYNLLSLPRFYHRRCAVQFISSRVLREMGVMEEGIVVSLQDSAPSLNSAHCDSSVDERPPDLLESSNTSTLSS